MSFKPLDEEDLQHQESMSWSELQVMAKQHVKVPGEHEGMLGLILIHVYQHPHRKFAWHDKSGMLTSS